jgi:hypothetical protein
MRPSEFLALKWSDINWRRGAASVSRTIRVSGSAWAFDDTKRKRSRQVVEFQSFVLAALHALRERQRAEGEGNCSPANDLIFVIGPGKPLRQRMVKREFRKLLKKAGIRSVRLYDLRHTAATLGIAAGVSVKVISDQLGHASISFTLVRHSHVLPSIQDEAAAKVERLLVARIIAYARDVCGVLNLGGQGTEGAEPPSVSPSLNSYKTRPKQRPGAPNVRRFSYLGGNMDARLQGQRLGSEISRALPACLDSEAGRRILAKDLARADIAP